MTRQEAKQYVDNYISHIISMVEYGNYFASELKDLVNKAKSSCDRVLNSHKSARTKSICKNCQKEIDNILFHLEEDISDFIESEIKELIKKEKLWLEENIVKPLDISFDFSDKFADKLLLLPITTAGIVGLYGKSVSDKLRNLYQQEIMQSYVGGIDFEDIDFESRFNSFNRGLQSDSITIGESISSQYDRLVFTKNTSKITGYMWLSILDTNTCIVCASFDHMIFKKIEEVPIYPSHQACRCFVILVTEEIEEVIPESYSEWFEQQSDSDKYKILGKSRYQLYKDGMKIKQFVNNGTKIPLKDIKK